MASVIDEGHGIRARHVDLAPEGVQRRGEVALAEVMGAGDIEPRVDQGAGDGVRFLAGAPDA